MLIDVTLQVSGIDLDDARTGEILGEQFPMLLWHRSDERVLVAFEVEERKAPAAVLDTVRALEAAIPGFRAIRIDRDLVSTTDIGARIGVSREAARKWGKEPDFPAPVAVLGESHRAWLWRDVVAWLDVTRGIVIDERLPSEAVMVQIDNCLMRNPDATTVHWETLNLLASDSVARKTVSAARAEVNVTSIEFWRANRVPSVVSSYSRVLLGR
tara:strand:- start:3028 stop:3666 length:639 start_codon:yes stop_codon:yes gene_type:complete